MYKDDMYVLYFKVLVCIKWIVRKYTMLPTATSLIATHVHTGHVCIHHTIQPSLGTAHTVPQSIQIDTHLVKPL